MTKWSLFHFINKLKKKNHRIGTHKYAQLFGKVAKPIK